MADKSKILSAKDLYDRLLAFMEMQGKSAFKL
jgi:hypothetical protein